MTFNPISPNCKFGFSISIVISFTLHIPFVINLDTWHIIPSVCFLFNLPIFLRLLCSSTVVDCISDDFVIDLTRDFASFTTVFICLKSTKPNPPLYPQRPFVSFLDVLQGNGLASIFLIISE